MNEWSLDLNWYLCVACQAASCWTGHCWAWCCLFDASVLSFWCLWALPLMAHSHCRNVNITKRLSLHWLYYIYSFLSKRRSTCWHDSSDWLVRSRQRKNRFLQLNSQLVTKQPTCTGWELNPGQLLGKQLCSPLHHQCLLLCCIHFVLSFK